MCQRLPARVAHFIAAAYNGTLSRERFRGSLLPSSSKSFRPSASADAGSPGYMRRHRWSPVVAQLHDATVCEVLAMLIFVPFRQGWPQGGHYPTSCTPWSDKATWPWTPR